MSEADVRDERGDSQSIGMRRDGGEHGEAIGCHSCDRIAGRRAGQEDVVTLYDTRDADLVEPPGEVGRVRSVVRPGPRPRQRDPQLRHAALPRWTATGEDTNSRASS